jgi:hypothetical protein
MEEQKKLAQDEFDMLQNLKKEGTDIATALGELSYQQITIELQLDEQKNRLKVHKEKESIFFKAISEKYGNVVLNIDTGVMS